MSATAKHTPGPWAAVRTPSGYAIDSASAMVAKVPFSDATAKADANLIAAAPDLLAAARAAEAVFANQKWIAGSTDPEAVAWQMLQAAITKAEGRK